MAKKIIVLGGGGLTALQVREQILVNYVNPIGFLLAVTAARALGGGVGFMITHFRK
ncbi:MAG: hypothetical protein M1368_10395 [Thaumarchaeota archaeon]|nr:hypothetical protein [Nitrososphaerota archaeon]